MSTFQKPDNDAASVVFRWRQKKRIRPDSTQIQTSMTIFQSDRRKNFRGHIGSLVWVKIRGGDFEGLGPPSGFFVSHRVCEGLYFHASVPIRTPLDRKNIQPCSLVLFLFVGFPGDQRAS